MERGSGGEGQAAPEQADPPGQADRRLPHRLLRVVTALAVLLLVGATTWFLWFEREQELGLAASLSERRAQRLASELQQTLALARVAITHAEERLRRLPAGASLERLHGDTSARQAELFAALAIPFELHALNGAGEAIALAARPAAGDHGHRHPGPSPAPEPGRWQVGQTQGPPGARTLPLVWTAAPNPHGVVGYAVDLAHAALLRRLESSRAPTGGSVALFRIEADGATTVLARAPQVDAEIGQRVRGPLAQALAAAPRGQFVAVTQLDRTPRLVAYQRLPGDADALVVVYGIATEGILADWQGHVPIAVAVVLLLSAGMLYGGRRLERSLQAQDASHRALERSEGYLRTLAGNLPDVVVRFDRHYRHLYANAAVERATGLPPEAFIGKTNAELGMPAAQVAMWTACLARVFESGDPERLEFSYPGPTGTSHWESIVAREPLGAGEAPTVLVISRDITERRRLEQAQRQASHRLDTVANASPVLFRTSGTDKGCDWFNQRWLDFTGRTLAQELGDGWTEGLHPQDRERCLSTYHRAFDALQPFSMEYRLRRHDGQYRWLIDQGMPRHDADGLFIGYIGSCLDVTEAKELQRRIEQTGRDLQEAQQVAHIGSWQLELATNQIEWSAETYRLFGVTAGRSVDLDFFVSRVHADDRIPVLQAWHAALRGETFDIEHRVPVGAQVRWLRQRARLETDDQGRPVRALGTAQDITAEKRLREQLQASEREYRQLFQVNPQPMWIYHKETLRFLAVNDAALRTYGYSLDEFLAMTIVELRPPEERDELARNLSRANTGYQESGPWIHCCRDGTHIQVEIRADDIDFQGQRARLVLATDVTARLRAEQALRASEQRFRLAAAFGQVWEWDIGAGRVNFPDAFWRDLGLPPPAPQDSVAALEALVGDAERQRRHAALAAHLREGQPYALQTEVQDAQGRRRWFQTYGQAVRDADGVARTMVGTIFEITEQRVAEDALRASQARLAHLQRSAPVVIYTAKAQGDYGATYYSPNLQDMVGWAPERFIADSGFWLDHVHPEDRDPVLGQMDALLQQGQATFEYRFAHADGGWRWMRDAIRVVYDDAGTPLELVGSWIDISERREAEQALAAAHAEATAARDLMHQVLERVDDGFVALDREWRYTYLNSRGARLLGRERPEDLIGRHIWTEYPEGRDQPFQRAYQQAMQTQQPLMLEAHFAPWDRWFENRIYPSPEGLSIYFTDITLRRKAEAAMRDSEQLLRHFFDSGLVGMAITVPSKHWGRFNPRLCEMLGYDAEQMQRMTWAEMTHPDDLAADLAQFERVLAGQADGYRMDKRFIRGDGTVLQAAIAVHCDRDADGRPLRFYAIVEDVGARRQTEALLARQREDLERRVRLRTAELARSEARFRTIFETVPVSIGEEDWSGVQRLLRELRTSGVSDGPAYFASRPDFVERCLRAVRVVRLNQQALRLHDARDQARDLPDLQAVYPSRDDLPQFVGELEALWAGERLYVAKKSLPSRLGRPLSLMLTMSLPALDDEDDGTALVCLVDITEIDRLNAEVERSVARLRQVNQELETFTYSVSHDLKAPLRGIDGYSRLLLTEHRDKLDDEGREFLNHIRQATQHMGVLIDDLLTYSRLERRELTLARLPLAMLVDGVLASYRQDLAARQVALSVDIPGALCVLGDAQGLTMALRNLIDNALKFRRGDQPPVLGITTTRIEGAVRLAVRDNGVGFDMKFHDRIFAIFQRLHRAEEYPGTGVGLAIVRKAMERMGGRAWAESQPGQGATFTLELPEAP